MPPTPQLGHLAQELVSPMVKEEVQEDFSALKDEAGVEVGCRGEVRTHIHTYKPIFLSCAFPRCVCKEDQVVFFSVEVVCFGAASTVRWRRCSVAQASLRGGKGSQWWHGGGAATCMCRRGWVAGEGRCTSDSNAEQAIRNAVQAGLQRWTSVRATLNKRFGTLHKRVCNAVQALWNAAQACVQGWASDSLSRSGTFRGGNTEVVFHGILKAQYLMKC